jgi:DNA replicative helicase MCM subunit Mcm2 (Cdc46/Mcm family)
MVLENKQSLSIDFRHLVASNKPMAKWLAHHPIHFLPEMNAALYSIVCHAFPNYQMNNAECFARIYNLPVVDNLRSLSHSHLGKLIKCMFKYI